MKIIYWIATLAMCGIMLFSAQMYFFNTDMVRGFFESLDYPTYLVIPLAIAKICGIIVILTNKIKWLKEWAYAGFFFDMVLAFTAHHIKDDGQGLFATLGLIFLIISYTTSKKVRP
ncbi:DoxX family protein [Aquimarina sp. BL5]|uniref:DoxX family protein n=1 Tax=Aquimarina sp. BL5 TaxID=1714860 RepID=UPI000E510CE8|nr:DoxX family protein [Aquimarina sp. BL5]AXT52132.1 DoxX family protein [Aquimarina sp. BL5]RKN10788.1 DoxX family protein [Aquimarina sp. BL5]